MSPSCDCIVYRAILRSGWIDQNDTNRLQPDAFFRREPKLKDDGERDPKDEEGLSLFLASALTPEQCVAEFNTCFGVASLHVGTLRDLGLVVNPDSEDNRKVLVPNLPYEGKATADEEKLLGMISKTARIIHRCRKRQ